MCEKSILPSDEVFMEPKRHTKFNVAISKGIFVCRKRGKGMESSSIIRKKGQEGNMNNKI